MGSSTNESLEIRFRLFFQHVQHICLVLGLTRSLVKSLRSDGIIRNGVPHAFRPFVAGQLYAAFEYAHHGNLKGFLRKNSDPESQRDSNSTRMFFASDTSPLQIALDVSNGMLYLSNKKVRPRLWGVHDSGGRPLAVRELCRDPTTNESLHLVHMGEQN